MTANSKANPGQAIEALIDVMARLRDPENGCPWDLEQTFKTIAPYTIEEAYEVADAIERDHMPDLKEELGDLLFQTVFHARMAEEIGAFDFAAVASGLAEKMIVRHPHVFADDSQSRDAEQQTQAWEEQKAAERASKGKNGILDDVPVGLPALTRAVKLQKRAARVGFDWTDANDILDKVTEEASEVVEALESGDHTHAEEEFGDLLFVLANLARRLDIDPENAARRANEKFTRRFRHIEQSLKADKRDLKSASLQEMEALWVEAKEQERNR